MTKRKRASLKDKSPETLGLTSSKKGKGIDLLFGGPVEHETDKIEDSNAQDNADDNVFVVANDRAVDELGLPVALEEPPDDLIPAAPQAGVTSSESEVDAVDPSTSPFAMPLPTGSQPGLSDDANNFLGLQENDNSPMEDTNLADSENVNDLSGLVVDNSSPSTWDAGDLSGLVVEDSGLSGLTAAPSPSATSPDPLAGLPVAGSSTSGLVIDDGADLSGLGVADEGASGSASAPEPVYATPPVSETPPVSQPAPAYQAAPAAVPPVAPTPQMYAPVTPSTQPEPVVVTTAAGPTRFQPGVAISSVTGLVTQGGPISEKDILPEDVLTKAGDHVITVERRETLERDAAATEKIISYLGPERRKQLDDEIMQLYQTVSVELSDNKDDASFALKTLREAQDIVIEDISQYDEAVYRVAVVRTMLVRKQNLSRWSYTWGMFVFFYALIWLILFVAGIYFIDPNASEAPNAGAAAIRSAWLSSLAGGIGGVIAILYSLSWRIAIKHEFDRQYIMKYLVQPVMGFVLGALMFFITSAGFLIFNSADTASGENAFLGGATLIATQLILGFVAGFRQRTVYYLIDRIVEKIAPEDKGPKGPTSVVPTEDYQQLQSQ